MAGFVEDDVAGFVFCGGPSFVDEDGAVWIGATVARIDGGGGGVGVDDGGGFGRGGRRCGCG